MPLRLQPTFAALGLLLTLPALAPADTILGRLGKAKVVAQIFAAPNSHARVFCNASVDQYVVVRSCKRADWYEVLLNNYIYGYIRTASVSLLPYQVTAPKAPLASRGNTSSKPEGLRGAMANYALKFVGTPYVWGGNDVNNGVDCSGFVKKMYGAIGINLPRTAAEQALVGTPITRYEDLRKGDRLYFWEAKRNKIGHTGIYIGNGSFVHSSVNHKGVATDYLTAKWQKILVAARR